MEKTNNKTAMRPGRAVWLGAGLLCLLPLQSRAEPTRVLKAGDTMTGQLTLAGSTLSVTGSAFSVGGSTLVVKDGNVGIGTTAPAGKLQIGALTNGSNGSINGATNPTRLIVNGASGSEAALTLGYYSAGYGLNLWVPANPSAPWPTFIDNINASSGFRFRNNTSDTPVELMTIDGGGNIGIGTMSPQAKLDILAANQTIPRLSAINLVSQATAVGDKLGISFAQDAVSDRGRAGIYAVSELASGYSSSLAFYTRYAEDGTQLANTDEKVRITSAGNVGVGTTNPQKGLDIENSVNGLPPASGSSIVGGLRIANSGNIAIDFGMLTNASPYPGWIQVHDSNNWASNFPLLLNPNGGNVGIGTTGPASKLEVTGDIAINTGYLIMPNGGYFIKQKDAAGTARGLIGFDTSDNLQIYNNTGADGGNIIFANKTGAAESVRIDSTGNVGIGTTNPLQKLVVEKNANSATVLKIRNTDIGASAKTQLVLNPEGGVADAQIFFDMATAPFWSLGVDKSDSGKFKIATGANADFDSDANVMTLQSNGKVGIGTTGPEGTLDAYGAGYFGFQDYRTQAVQKVLVLRAEPVSGSYSQARFNFYTNPGTTVNGVSNFEIKSQYGAEAESGTLFKFKGNGDFYTAGKVGIGNASPGYPLDVTGVAKASGGFMGNYGTGYAAGLYTSGGGVILYFDSAGTSRRWDNDAVIKTFIIQHPLDKDKYLVHGTLEGPEGAVYYRGTGRLKNGEAVIALPEYFEALTQEAGRTVLLTNVDGFDRLMVKKTGQAQISGGKFTVRSDNRASAQEFNWEVKAVRKDVAPLTVEPYKKDLDVHGDGPYTFGTTRK